MERGGLPEQFRERLARVLEHYGVEDLERTPELEAAVFRIFLAQQRSTPEVALASAVLGLLERRDPADRDRSRSVPGRCWSASAASPSRATRSSATSPAASGSAGSTSRPWTRSARTSCSASATSSPRSRPPATSPTARAGSRRWRPSPSRSCASWPSGSSTASRRASRCWRCSPGATTASTTCATCSPWSRARRPVVVASYTLDDRPTRLVSVGRHGRRAGRPVRATSFTTLAGHVGDRAEDEEAVVDLYLHWAEAPEAADETSERLRALLAALPVAHDVRRICVAVCSGGERPVGYYVFRPDHDGGAGRGRPHPRRAPDGRAAPEPVAAAQLPRHARRGARGRAALRLRRAGEPVRPATGGARPGPPDVRGPRRVPARSRPCRTPSVRWRTAWSRSVAPAWLAGAPARSWT